MAKKREPQDIYRPTLQRPVRRSAWNALSPLLIGGLIVAILFAWILKKDRDRQNEEVSAYNEQVKAYNEAQRKAVEEEKARQKEKLRKYREDQAAKLKDKNDATKGKVAWLRQDGVVVKQSLTRGEMNAGLAVDGNKDGSIEAGTVSFALPVLNRKELKKEPAWWSADFGTNRAVTQINVAPGTDAVSKKRLSNYKIQLVDALGDSVWEREYFTDGKTFAEKEEVIELERPMTAKGIRIQLLGENANEDAALNISEVEVFGPKVNENELPSEYVD